MWLRISNLNKYYIWREKTLYPRQSTLPCHQYYIAFKDLSKVIICYWIVLRLVRVFIGNIKFLIFSFITTTFHYVIHKKRYQHNAFQSIDLSVDHWVERYRNMLTYDNLANPGLSQGNPSWNWSQLRNF